MAVGTWWIVNDTLKRILGGPFLWDDENAPIPVNAPVRVTNTDPATAGYTVASADTGTLAARVAALEARVLGEVRGIATVPAITNVLGATVNVDVTLKKPVRDAQGSPTTAYAVQAMLVPGALLGSLTIPSAPTIISEQVVRVPVKSTGLVTLGQATVLVFADANG